MRGVQHINKLKLAFLLRGTSQLQGTGESLLFRGVCFRHLSSSPSKEAPSSSKNDRNANNNKKFPWRHSTNLLPRVELLLVELNRSRSARAAKRIWEGTIATLLMQKRLSEVIGDGGEWRKELAENGAGAWTLASAALLSNTFKVPMDDLIIRDGGDLKLNFSYTTPYNTTSTRQSTESIQEKVNSSIASLDGLLDDDYVNLYRNFYRQSHEHQALLQINPMEINLTVEPKVAELNILYAFPGFSRNVVKEDPTRADAFQQIVKAATESGFVAGMNKAMAFCDQVAVERGKLETTVIADVVVTCIEHFQVKDLITDEILQGREQNGTAVHTVRMEMDVALDGDEEATRTDWRIVDVDDMVKGRGDIWTVPFP